MFNRLALLLSNFNNLLRAGNTPASDADIVVPQSKGDYIMRDEQRESLVDKIQKPIFIVGCGRSGTGMLFDLLSQHPDVVRTAGYPSGEDHEGWIKYGECVMAGIGEGPQSIKYGTGINGYNACLHMTAQDLTTDIIANMHSYYWNDVLLRAEGKRIINKCPHNSNKIDYMLGIFPDAKIIHIIRDCEPTVLSWLAVMNQHPEIVVYWPEEKFPCLWLLPKPKSASEIRRLDRHPRFFPGGGAKLFIDYWKKINMGIAEQMQSRLNQLMVVRYEDILSKPESVLNELVEFCELKPYGFSLTHLESNSAEKHMDLLTPILKNAIEQESTEIRRHFSYLAN